MNFTNNLKITVFISDFYNRNGKPLVHMTRNLWVTCLRLVIVYIKILLTFLKRTQEVLLKYVASIIHLTVNQFTLNTLSEIECCIIKCFTFKTYGFVEDKTI